MKSKMLAIFGIGTYLVSVLSSATDSGGNPVASIALIVMSAIATGAFIIAATIYLWKKAKGVSIVLASSAVVRTMFDVIQVVSPPSYGNPIIILSNVTKVIYLIAFVWAIVKLFTSRKQEVSVEDFCRDFYDTKISNPVIGEINAGNVFSDVVKKNVVEVYPEFAKIESEKLAEEIKVLRFELFALALAHKFVSGKVVVAQSDFTKTYLHEKGKNDIWAGMELYNNMIDSVTLHWLTNLGKMNLSFNYNMRKDLTKKNIEVAKELGIENDDRVARVNHRLWSENAWKQKLMLGPLVFTFCERIGVNAHDLNQEAQFRLAATIKGLYDGAEQSWDKVKIKI